MQLKIYVHDALQTINVPPPLLTEAESFFTKMDSDMDEGYQMSRTWVANPNLEQRCQIVADRLLTTLSSGSTNSTMMMAAYILKRAPQICEIHFNTEGDMTEHLLLTTDQTMSNNTSGIFRQ